MCAVAATSDRAPASEASRGVVARLDATFAPGPRGVIARASRSGALELRGPFEGGPLPRFVLRNVTAGVFGGDAYEVNLRATAGAQVAIAPTAASKVYSARNGTACSRLRVDVEAGALLDYDAGAVILQRASRLVQTVDLVAHPGGALAYREIVALGRLARGERLEFGRYASTLRMLMPDGTQLYEERCDLRPTTDAEAIDAAVGGAGVVGTLILAGGGTPALPDDLGDVYAGITALPNDTGLLVRALAPRVEVVEALFASLVAEWTHVALADSRETSEKHQRDRSFNAV